MPSLQVRDLPLDVYTKLVDRAKREHRSIAQQATFLLTEALKDEPTPRERRQRLLEEIARRGDRVDFAKYGTPEDLIREDRDR
jgi:plasmid stability protein